MQYSQESIDGTRDENQVLVRDNCCNTEINEDNYLAGRFAQLVFNLLARNDVENKM